MHSTRNRRPSDARAGQAPELVSPSNSHSGAMLPRQSTIQPFASTNSTGSQVYRQDFGQAPGQVHYIDEAQDYIFVQRNTTNWLRRATAGIKQIWNGAVYMEANVMKAGDVSDKSGGMVKVEQEFSGTFSMKGCKKSGSARLGNIDV